ncbi:MAG: outer spore coat protein CotE [Firmicutes bacterium]|nr:outer spore coat protein CotE [Bacillota bacterium]
MSEKKEFKNSIRTILTKAVCGRALQTCQTTVYINPRDNVVPNNVLGCTIKKAKIKEKNFEGSPQKSIQIRIDGEFELHVWYETDGDTIVAKSNVKFSEVLPVETLESEKYYEDDFYSKHIMAWISKEPVFLGSMIVNKTGTPAIAIQLEYELGVEIMGDVKLNVLSYTLDNHKAAENTSCDNAEHIGNNDYDDGDY